MRKPPSYHQSKPYNWKLNAYESRFPLHSHVKRISIPVWKAESLPFSKSVIFPQLKNHIIYHIFYCCYYDNFNQNPFNRPVFHRHSRQFVRVICQAFSQDIPQYITFIDITYARIIKKRAGLYFHSSFIYVCPKTSHKDTTACGQWGSLFRWICSIKCWYVC